MDTANAPRPDHLAPNHHAHHPGFGGLSGFVAAATMAFGRTDDARTAAALAALRPGDRVVDVGCGPGSAARWAAASGAEVVGIDPAQVMLRMARLLDPRGRATYRVGAAESVPVADGWATVVWTMASVHHWPDLAGAIAEARRVLAPAGRFVAIERAVDAGASGLASHGWVRSQADGFAQLCRDGGFEAAEVVEVRAARGPALAVVARTSR